MHTTCLPPFHWCDATSVPLEVQIIKIFTVQFSPVSRQFLLLSPQHLPQHLVHEIPNTTFFPSISVSQRSCAGGPLLSLILRICAAHRPSQTLLLMIRSYFISTLSIYILQYIYITFIDNTVLFLNIMFRYNTLCEKR